MGRLGNSLFQIASTIGIAIDNEMNYVFPKWHYSGYFKNPIPQIDEIKADRTYQEGDQHVKLELDRRGQVFDLRGYWQSFIYFEKHWSHIKKYFELREEVLARVKKQVGQLSQGNPTCSIHVRRKDFLNFPDKHPICPEDYYLEALIKIEEKHPGCVYLICSDDLEWCKKVFKGPEFKYVQGNEDILDLYLMAICEHNIICNSTFSWWSAWLNENKNKTVITPDESNWFGVNLKHLDISNLLPKDWVRIKY